jgi:hypothetical protein
MAVAFRSATSSTGLAPSLPSGTTTDDVVLAVYSGENSGVTVVAPTGGAWTNISTDTSVNGGGELQHHTWWARKTAAALNSTWTDSGGGGRVCLVTYSGCKTSGSPINASRYAEGVNNLSIPSITTTVDACMIVGFYNCLFWGTYTSADFTNERIDQGEAIAVYDDGLLATAGATGAMAVTRGGGTMGGTLVALEPPGGGGAQDDPELRGRPYGRRGGAQMHQLLAQ